MAREKFPGPSIDGSPDRLPPEGKSRAVLWFLLKGTVATGLVAWLLASSTLEVRSLRVLVSSGMVLATTILTWLIAAVFLASLRWRLLLAAAGRSISLRRAIGLQMMASLFNWVVPGNVGGDVLKNVYVFGGSPSRVVGLSVSERVVGLGALFWTGLFGSLLGARAILASPELRILALVLAIGAVSFAVAPFVIVAWLPAIERRFRESGTGRFSGLLGRVRGFVDLVRTRSRLFLLAFVLSIGIHIGNIVYFYVIASALAGVAPPIGSVALVFPLGALSLVLPISFAGIGVGHVAFEQLFRLVGLDGGANVFNTFLVGTMVPCVLGILPYVSMRSRPAPAA